MCILYFYPRSPCGERHGDNKKIKVVRIFLSTLSLRRATKFGFCDLEPIRFLSTLSLRRATYLGAGKSCDVRDFYPRSPCGERHQGQAGFAGYRNFYPRSPCGERLMRIFTITVEDYFYPRSPCGERQCGTVRASPITGISIHALLAESDSERPGTRRSCAISIHALLAESDGSHHRSSGPFKRFLSTLSLRRATIYTHPIGVLIAISIHALLAESDFKPPIQTHRQKDFYPRSPCGERRELV